MNSDQKNEFKLLLFYTVEFASDKFPLRFMKKNDLHFFCHEKMTKLFLESENELLSELVWENS